MQDKFGGLSFKSLVEIDSATSSETDLKFMEYERMRDKQRRRFFAKKTKEEEK